MSRSAPISILLMVISAVAAYAQSPPAVDASPTASDPWAAVEPKLTLDESPVLMRNKADAPLRSAPAAAAPSWLRSFSSLVAVLALIGLLTWGYRTISGGPLLSGRGRRPELIEVVARHALAPKHSLCLVRIGPRMTLVGVSGERMAALDVIEDAALVARLAGDAQRADADSPEFHESLQQEASAYRVAVEPLPSPPTAPVGSRAAAMVQRLRRLSDGGAP